MSNNNFNIPKLNTYLNSDEVKELEYLNNIAEKTNESIKDRTALGNLTVNEILKNWSNVNMQVFIDLVNLFSNIDKYSSIIDDEQSNTIFKAMLTFLSDLRYIFIKDKRAVYIGMTLILVSILFYFIGITS